MNIPFAKFMLLAPKEDTAASITTDPVALGEYDRASVVPFVHYFHGPNTPTFTYLAQVSQNGIIWVDTTLTKVYQAGGSPPLTTGALGQETKKIYGQFIRFVLDYQVAGVGTGTGALCFDLMVNLDKGDVS